MEYNLDFADLCFSREETEPCVKLEGCDDSKKEASVKAGHRIIGCLQLLLNYWFKHLLESIACTCFAIKYIQFF